MERAYPTPKRCVLYLIRAYKFFLSPILPRCCRFYPTCSQYALEAVDRHGVIKGLAFGFKRVLKCHPWHPGGFDPVPSLKPQSEKERNRKTEYGVESILSNSTFDLGLSGLSMVCSRPEKDRGASGTRAKQHCQASCKG